MQETLFCEWESAHNIQTEHINVNNVEEVMELAESQKIDGVISTETIGFAEKYFKR